MTTAHFYTQGAKALAQKKVDWVSDTVTCYLLGDAYTPDQDAHDTVSDLGTILAQANVSGKTATDSAGVVTLDCADVVFPVFTAADVRYAVFAVNTGVPGTSPLLCYLDHETTTDVTAQPATQTIDAAGLITLTVS